MTDPTREQMLAEGRKQADIHGVDMGCARVYAEGWAAAMARADRAIEEAQRAADKSVWDANFNAGLVHKGRVEELERQVGSLQRTVDDQLSSSARGALRIAELERDNAQLQKQVRVLEERIRKVREIRDEIECSNCEHAAKLHDGGKCTRLRSFLGREHECGCTWGGGDLVAQLDAALDGEGEEVELALEPVNPADLASMEAIGKLGSLPGLHVQLEDEQDR